MCGKAQPHDKKQAQFARGQQHRKRKQQLDGDRMKSDSAAKPSYILSYAPGGCSNEMNVK
jgi:hypothetical protein